MATLEKIASVSAQVVFDRYGHKTGQDVLFYHAESLTKIGSADPKEIEAYFDLTEKIGSYLFTSVCDQYGLDAVKVAHWAEYERKLPWFYLDELVEGLQKTAAVTQVGSKVLSGTRAVLNPLVQAEKAVAQNVGQSAARAVTPPKPPAAAFGRTPKPAPAPQATAQPPASSPRPTAQTGATKGTAPTGQTNITSRGQTTGPNPATAVQSDATIAKSFPVPDAPLNLGATEGAAQQAAKKTWGQTFDQWGRNIRATGKGLMASLPGGVVGVAGLGTAALGSMIAAPVVAGAGLAAGAAGAGMGLYRGVKAFQASRAGVSLAPGIFSRTGRAALGESVGAGLHRAGVVPPSMMMNNYGRYTGVSAANAEGAVKAFSNPQVLQRVEQIHALPPSAITAEANGTFLMRAEQAESLGLKGQDASNGFVRFSTDPRLEAIRAMKVDENTARMLADPTAFASLKGMAQGGNLQHLQQYAQHAESLTAHGQKLQQAEAELARARKASADLEAKAGRLTAEEKQALLASRQEIETLEKQVGTIRAAGEQHASQLSGYLGNQDLQGLHRQLGYAYNRTNPITGMGAAAEAKAVGSSADEIARLSGGGAQAEKAFLQEGTQAGAAGATGTAGAQAGATGTAGAQAGAAGAAPGAAWTQSAHLEQQAVKAEMSGLSSHAQKLEQQIQTNTAAGLTDPVVKAQTDELIRQRNALQSRIQTLQQRESQLNYMIEQNPQMQAMFGQDFSAAVLQSQGGAAAGATGGGLVQGVTDAAKGVASSVQEAAQPAVGAMRSFWNENKKTLVPLGLLGGAGYMGIKGIEALNRPAYAPQGY